MAPRQQKTEDINNKYQVRIPAGLSLTESFSVFEKLVLEKEQCQNNQENKIDLNIKLSEQQIIDILNQFGFITHIDFKNVYQYKEKKVQLTVKPGQTLKQLIRLMLNCLYISGYYENK